MQTTGDLKVSKRGQLSLPASARKRWGIEAGGELGFIDLGGAVILVPSGAQALRTELLDAVTDEDWADARAGFGDDDLTTE